MGAGKTFLFWLLLQKKGTGRETHSSPHERMFTCLSSLIITWPGDERRTGSEKRRRHRKIQRRVSISFSFSIQYVFLVRFPHRFRPRFDGLEREREKETTVFKTGKRRKTGQKGTTRTSLSLVSVKKVARVFELKDECYLLNSCKKKKRKNWWLPSSSGKSWSSSSFLWLSFKSDIISTCNPIDFLALIIFSLSLFEFEKKKKFAPQVSLLF